MAPAEAVALVADLDVPGEGAVEAGVGPVALVGAPEAVGEGVVALGGFRRAPLARTVTTLEKKSMIGRMETKNMRKMVRMRKNSWRKKRSPKMSRPMRSL